MIQVTAHGAERMKERCKIKSKSVVRLAQIAFDKGLCESEAAGALHGYIRSLYDFNGQANNIRLYGDKIYIFCNDTLVTVYDTPKRFQNTIHKLMRKRRDNEKG